MRKCVGEPLGEGGGAWEHKGVAATHFLPTQQPQERRVARGKAAAAHARRVRPKWAAAPKRERQGEEGWTRGNSNLLLHHPINARAFQPSLVHLPMLAASCETHLSTRQTQVRGRAIGQRGWRVGAEGGQQLTFCQRSGRKSDAWRVEKQQQHTRTASDPCGRQRQSERDEKTKGGQGAMQIFSCIIPSMRGPFNLPCTFQCLLQAVLPI